MQFRKKILKVKNRSLDRAKLRYKGEVIETLPSLNFRVKLDDGRSVLCHLAGKLRLFKIKILPGDRVTVEMTPYDEKRGRIIYREK